jgi:hypothetical protein
MFLYHIFDTIADDAGPLFAAKNDGVAWRNYQDLLKKSPVPDDFELYCVGSFNHDDMTGSFDSPYKVKIETFHSFEEKEVDDGE